MRTEQITEETTATLARLHIEKMEIEDKITDVLKHYDKLRLSLAFICKDEHDDIILNMIQCKGDVKKLYKDLFELNEIINRVEVECVIIYENDSEWYNG